MDDLLPKIGDIIRIIDMRDEPRYAGKMGVIKFIDDAGQMHGTWGGCAVVPNIDRYEIIEKKEYKKQ